MPERGIEHSRDCTLAMGLPLARRKFMRDLKSADGRDLPRRLRDEVPGSTDLEGWQRYKPVVETATRVIRRARRLGVKVVLDAKVKDVGKLLHKYRVVTFFSHYPLLYLETEDILDPSALARRLSEDATLSSLDEGEHLRRDAARVWRRQGGDQAAGRDKLADVLNSLIARDADYWGIDVRGKPADEDEQQPLVRVTRMDLELVYGGLIAERSTVDFGDGARPVRELIEAVPVGFDGTLDLITCHSVVTGETIRARRKCGANAVILTAQKPVRIQHQLSIYNLILDELSQSRASYLEVATRIRSAVESYLESK